MLELSVDICDSEKPVAQSFRAWNSGINEPTETALTQLYPASFAKFLRVVMLLCWREMHWRGVPITGLMLVEYNRSVQGSI